MSQSRKSVGRNMRMPGEFERVKCWEQANENNVVIESTDTGRALKRRTNGYEHAE